MLNLHKRGLEKGEELHAEGFGLDPIRDTAYLEANTGYKYR